MHMDGYQQKSSTQATEQSVDTTSFEDLLGLLKSRLKVAKAFCKKPHEAWHKYIDEYDIKDSEDVNEIRDKIRIPTIFRQVESDLPSIFDDQPDIFLKGRGKYRQFNSIFANTYDWLWDSQNLEVSIEDAATYFDLLGMGFMESPWLTKTKTVNEVVSDPQTGQMIPDAKGQPQIKSYDVPIKDQPDAQVGDPFKYYFSPETIFSTVLTYDKCPYYFKEQSMTQDQIKARFNVDIEPSGELNTTDADLNTEISNLKANEGKDDMKRETVYEYYGCLPEKLAPKSKEPWSYDKDYHIYFTMKEKLQAEECQYPTKPLLVLGNYGLANKFWKTGDAKYLIPLNQEQQQYRRQILKHARRLANPKAMLPNDADVDEAAFDDPNVGRSVKYSPSATGAKPEYMQAPALGREVFEGLQTVKADIEQTKGQFSLAEGSNQSQVKTPRGIQVFSEAADKNVRRKKKKVARFIKQLMIFQFKECSQNWNAQDPKVSDILSGGIEDMVLAVPEALQLLGDENILSKVDIEVESLSTNKVQMKQDALDLFDLASKFPFVFNLDEMAKDVLQNGFGKKDADRYLATDQQKQQFQELQKINRSQIRAAIQLDGADPIGAQILENEGFLQPGQSQPLAQASQQVKQVKDVGASVPYKDLPMEGKIQKAGQAGIQLDPQAVARQDHQQQAQESQQNQIKLQAIQQKGQTNGIR